MTVSLKPCPFCGSDATDVWPDGRTNHYVKCNGCGARTCTHVAAHGGSAADDWNRRDGVAHKSGDFGPGEDWDVAAHVRLLRAGGGPSSGYTADLIERLFAALHGSCQQLEQARERNLIANERADSAQADLERFRSERSYVVGCNTGWDEAIEQAAQIVEGFQVPKSHDEGDLKPRRYPSQTSIMIAAAIRKLAGERA